MVLSIKEQTTTLEEQSDSLSVPVTHDYVQILHCVAIELVVVQTGSQSISPSCEVLSLFGRQNIETVLLHNCM